MEVRRTGEPLGEVMPSSAHGHKKEATHRYTRNRRLQDPPNTFPDQAVNRNSPQERGHLLKYDRPRTGCMGGAVRDQANRNEVTQHSAQSQPAPTPLLGSIDLDHREIAKLLEGLDCGDDEGLIRP